MHVICNQETQKGIHKKKRQYRKYILQDQHVLFMKLIWNIYQQVLNTFR